MNKPILTIEYRTQTSLKHTFNYILGINPADTFNATLLIPGIEEVYYDSVWNSYGGRRTLYLEGGIKLLNTLQVVIPGKEISQNILGFSSPFNKLISEIDIKIVFYDAGQHSTALSLIIRFMGIEYFLHSWRSPLSESRYFFANSVRGWLQT